MGVEIGEWTARNAGRLCGAPEISFECSQCRTPEVSHTPPTQTPSDHKNSRVRNAFRRNTLTRNHGHGPRATTIDTEQHSAVFHNTGEGYRHPADDTAPEPGSGSLIAQKNRRATRVRIAQPRGRSSCPYERSRSTI